MFDEVEEDVEAFLRRQIRVVLLIGAIGVLEAVKDFRDLFHEDRITQPSYPAYGRPGALADPASQRGPRLEGRALEKRVRAL